jgi:hypothetical protein
MKSTDEVYDGSNVEVVWGSDNIVLVDSIGFVFDLVFPDDIGLVPIFR